MPSEAALLLASIARTDKRTANESEAIAWAEIMTERNVNLDDAIAGARQHFATSTDYCTPAHVVTQAKAIARRRWEQAGDPPIPDGLTWQQEKQFRRLWCDQIKSGLDPKSARRVAVEQMQLPPELPPVPESVARERAALIQSLANSKAIPDGRQR